MPDPGPNEQSLELPEVSPSPPLTVQHSPAPPALVVPGGWRIEGLPGTIREAGPSAERHLLEFFTAEISNPNTRLAYSTAAGRFFAWCETRNLALRGNHSLCRRHLYRGDARTAIPSPPSSSISQPSGPCSTTWSWARSCPQTPPRRSEDPSIRRQAGQDSGAFRRRGPHPARLDRPRRGPAGLRGSGAAGHHGLLLRPGRRRRRHERRGLLPAGQALVAPPPRKGRQIPPGPRPPQRRGVSRCLPRGGRDR